MKPWACYTCRNVKMKCVPADDGGACRRCLRLGHECRFPASERPLGNKSHRVTIQQYQRGSILQTYSTSPSEESTLDRLEYLEQQLGSLIAGRRESKQGGASPPPLKRRKGSGEAEGSSKRSAAAGGGESKKRFKSARHYDEVEYCQFLEQGSLSLQSQVQGPEEGAAGAASTGTPSADSRNEDQMGRAAILDTGLITMQEAERLFALFFDHYGPSLPLLDRERHSAEETLRKSTTLFTAICAVGSRSYKPRPELSDKIALAAELATAQMIIVCDCRTAQTLQALLIIAHWPRPSGALAASKTLLYSGIALRIGPEVCKLKGSLSIEDSVAYERLWLQFFSFDMLLSIQSATAPTLATSQTLLGFSETWWGRPGAAIYDVIICASVRLFYVLGVHVVDLAKASALPSSAGKQAGMASATASFKTAFDNWSHVWTARIKSMEQYLGPYFHVSPSDKAAFTRMQTQLHFHSAYVQLAIYSIALRSGAKGPSTGTREVASNEEYYTLCRDLARTIVSTVLPPTAPGEASRYLNLNYCDETDICIAAFAALYLRNLAKIPLAEPGAMVAAKQQIAELIDMLGQTPFLRSIREQQIRILSLALLQGSDLDTSPAPSSSSPSKVAEVVEESREADSVLQSALDDQYWQSLFFSPEKLHEAAFGSLIPLPASVPLV